MVDRLLGLIFIVKKFFEHRKRQPVSASAAKYSLPASGVGLFKSTQIDHKGNMCGQGANYIISNLDNIYGDQANKVRGHHETMLHRKGYTKFETTVTKDEQTDSVNIYTRGTK